MARATKASTAGSEEFLQALYKGGELLAAGKVIEAKDHLEKAYQLQPKNEKAQNLLGLAYFKLGLFDRASEIYEALVRENPADATLRVNLGLVYLKTNALPRAIREFETATDLSPEHKKGHNYLGLALAQAGEFQRARQHFVEAGSEAMVEKMDRALRGEEHATKTPSPKQPAKQRGFAEIEGAEVVAERGGQVAPTNEPPPVELMASEAESGPQDASAVGQSQEWGIEAEVETTAQPPAPQGRDEDAFSEHALSGGATPRGGDVVALPRGGRGGDRFGPSSSPASGGAVAASGGAGVAATASQAQAYAPPQPSADALAMTAGALPYDAPGEVDGALSLPIAELTPTLQLFPPGATGPFLVRGELVALVVRDQLLLRLAGLVTTSGKLELKPEAKRFRGRPTDKPFGEGEQRMVRATGQGMVVVTTGKRKFVSIELNDESGYFQEDAIFAFEESLAFENGRVPSDFPPDLDLVHLKGRGRVLLSLPGPLRSVEVGMERPAVVPMPNLVGWYGNISPRIAPLLLDAKGKPTRPGVELSGEGFALIAVPMG